MSNFYDKQSIPSIERVKLAEDVKLPALPKYTLTHDNLEAYGSPYLLMYQEYVDTEAKFYIPIMTPLLDSAEVKENKSTKAPSTKGHKGSLKTSNYGSANFINLVIPKYILLNFTDKVPKGTEFIAASVGGSIDMDDLRIIGIYSLV